MIKAFGNQERLNTSYIIHAKLLNLSKLIIITDTNPKGKHQLNNSFNSNSKGKYYRCKSGHGNIRKTHGGDGYWSFAARLNHQNSIEKVFSVRFGYQISPLGVESCLRYVVALKNTNKITLSHHQCFPQYL